MADISTGRQRGIVPFVDETTGRLPDQYLPQGVIDLQGDLEQAVSDASQSATAAKASETSAKASAESATQSASAAAQSAESASGDAAAAKTSAAGAASSASAAKASETAASSSATAAAESKDAAKASETAAARSAQTATEQVSSIGDSVERAAASATAAQQSASQAQSNATAANSSAQAAAASAESAQTATESAASSKDAAARSASAASESAQAAEASKTNAAASASAAEASKTNAAASASAAKTSETNAAASATAAQNAVDGFGLAVGTTTTGEPGSDAAVEIQKQGTKYTANFTIPRGDKGAAGVNENVPLGTASGLVAQAKDAYPALPRRVQVHGATSGTNTVEPTKLVAAGKNQWFDFLDEPFSKDGITVTPNGDGSYTINGENTRGSSIFIFEPYGMSKNLVPLSTVVVSCWDSQGKNIASDIVDRLIVQATCFTNTGAKDITTGTNSYGVVPQDYTSDRFQINIKPGASFDNLVIYPQVEFGDTPTSWQAAIPKIETNLPSDISLADGDTLTIDRDGTTQIVHAEGEPTVLENVTLPELPAPMFNVYTTGGSIQPTVDVDYERDVNLVLEALEAKIAALQVVDKTN